MNAHIHGRVFIAVYPAVGLVFGYLALQQISGNWLGRPGLANFLLINIVLPGCTAVLAALHRRPPSAALGGALMVIAFTLGRLMARDWQVWNWTFSSIKAGTHPIELAAAIGCAIVGGVAAMASRAAFPIGQAPVGTPCPKCGYQLAGLGAAACPECGAAKPPVP